MGDDWVHTYDNWYVEREPGETNQAYIDRSIRATDDFIKSYAARDEQSLLFALVVGAY
jgi:hypothetical protein